MKRGYKRMAIINNNIWNVGATTEVIAAKPIDLKIAGMEQFKFAIRDSAIYGHGIFETSTGGIVCYGDTITECVTLAKLKLADHCNNDPEEFQEILDVFLKPIPKRLKNYVKKYNG